MLFRDFARWLLLAFAFFAFAVLFVLAGQVGWLGPGAQKTLRELFSRVEALYTENKSDIDRAAWLLGIGASALTAALTVHRSWYYAEFNLPKRLLEFVERRTAEHVRARPVLLAAVNDLVAPTNFLGPVVYAGYFDWLLRAAGIGASQIAAKTHADSIDLLRDEIKVVRARQKELELHTVTAHLLRGAQLAGRAALLAANDPQRRDQNEKALQEFVAALEVAGDDVDALELAAKQTLVLGDDQSALNYLARMAAAAKAGAIPLRHARALRLQAEILEKRGDPDDWDLARGTLILAIDEVLAEIKQTNPEKTLELAKAYRIRGEVQLKREKFTAARTALNRAIQLFRALGAAGRDGVDSTGEALKRLDEAQRDREAPGNE